MVMVHAALGMGRRLALSLMDSTVRISRKSGTVRDPDTGQVTDAWTLVYEGPARLRFGQGDPRDLDVTGQRLAEQSPHVSLPIDSSGDVRVDDEGVVLTNPPDPAVVGLRFRIAGVHEQTHSTARRLPGEVFSHGG